MYIVDRKLKIKNKSQWLKINIEQKSLRDTWKKLTLLHLEIVLFHIVFHIMSTTVTIVAQSLMWALYLACRMSLKSHSRNRSKHKSTFQMSTPDSQNVENVAGGSFPTFISTSWLQITLKQEALISYVDSTLTQDFFLF